MGYSLTKPHLLIIILFNAVLISESDWRSLQETLHLSSIPGMKASLRKGRAEPLAKCKRKLTW